MLIPILNLTQHVGTPAQMEAGLVEPIHKDDIRQLLTIDRYDFACYQGGFENEQEKARADMAFAEILQERAKDLMHSALMEFASMDEEPTTKVVMIGGAPYLMSHLERALDKEGIHPAYALSDRVSMDVMLPDGKVKKVNEFVHLEFHIIWNASYFNTV